MSGKLHILKFHGSNMEWEEGWCLRRGCRERRSQITGDWIYKAKEFRLYPVSSGEPWKALKQGEV